MKQSWTKWLKRMIFSWWVYHDFWPCAFMRWDKKAVTPTRSNGWRTPLSNQIASKWKHLFNNQPTGNLFWWWCENRRYVWVVVVNDMNLEFGMWREWGKRGRYMSLHGGRDHDQKETLFYVVDDAVLLFLFRFWTFWQHYMTRQDVAIYIPYQHTCTNFPW